MRKIREPNLSNESQDMAASGFLLASNRRLLLSGIRFGGRFGYQAVLLLLGRRSTCTDRWATFRCGTLCHQRLSVRQKRLQGTQCSPT